MLAVDAISSRAHGFQPNVFIRRVERQRADREFERSGVQRSSQQPHSRATKRHAQPSQTEDSQPLRKRGRPNEKVVERQSPIKAVEAGKSSFGRTRTPKKTDKGYIYTDHIGNDQASPDETPLKKKKPGNDS